jgi:uncharacterized protein (TIGR04255 family)
MPPNKEDAKLNQKQDERNFLNRIIFRLDFSANIDVSEKKRKAFLSAVEGEFSPPQVEVRKTLQVAMGPEGNLINEGQAKLYHFTNRDGTKKIILEPTALVILFFSNVDPKELLSTVRSICTAFNKAYEKMTVIRTGLRHSYRIDRLEGGAFEWDDYISGNLISPIRFYPDENELTRVMNLIELNKKIVNKDGKVENYYRVTIQAGLSNSVDYPNPIRSKEFTLDYDCYTLKEQGVNSSAKLVNIFNTEIVDLFNKSIADGLRKVMGVL